LGGHLLSGHVDALGRLVARENAGAFLKLNFELDEKARSTVAPYLVEKGSIAIDGVSLTVNALRDFKRPSGAVGTHFEIMLIPHTLEKTFLGELKIGDLVNLEADLMAKYVNRYQNFGKTLHA
jgi:riboflavin synthase